MQSRITMLLGGLLSLASFSPLQAMHIKPASLVYDTFDTLPSADHNVLSSEATPAASSTATTFSSFASSLSQQQTAETIQDAKSRRNMKTQAALSNLPLTDISYVDTRPLSPYVIKLKTDTDGLHYMMPLRVGTPPQHLDVILDTGSGDLTLFSSVYCANTPARKSPNGCFNYNVSSTHSVLPTQRSLRLQVDFEDIATMLHPLVRDVGSVEYYMSGDKSFLNPAQLPGTPASIVGLVTSTFVVDGQYVNKSDALHSFPTADGLIGASYSPLSDKQTGYSPFLRFLQSVSNLDDRPVFGLDLQPLSSSLPSLMHVGGVPQPFQKSMVWTLQSQYIPYLYSPEYHGFAMFDMTLCGVNLFANFTSNWEVIIDTGAACLSLPGEFFDMVVNWAELECENVARTSVPLTARSCYVSKAKLEAAKQAGEPPLPSLSFRATQGSPLLHISLSRLLLPPDAQGRRKLCMKRGIEVNDADYATYQKTISFGTLVVQSLFTVFAMDTFQVGFANKVLLNATNTMCAAPVECKGMQTLNRGMNSCDEPECSRYFFFSYKDSTKVCELSTTFHIIAVLLFVFYLGTEIYMEEVTTWMCTKVVVFGA